MLSSVEDCFPSFCCNLPARFKYAFCFKRRIACSIMTPLLLEKNCFEAAMNENSNVAVVSVYSIAITVKYIETQMHVSLKINRAVCARIFLVCPN